MECGHFYAFFFLKGLAWMNYGPLRKFVPTH